jgi:hypothetical protein
MPRHLLIRDTFRGLFLCHRAEWSLESSVARDLEFTLPAAAFCVREKLCPSEVVVVSSVRPGIVISVDPNGEFPGGAGSTERCQ